MYMRLHSQYHFKAESKKKKKESYNEMFFHFSFTATSKFFFTCYKKLSWKILDDIIAAK